MLLNLVISLWRLGRGEEAIAVSRRAVGLAPTDDTGLHHLWLAVGMLAAGYFRIVSPFRR